MQAFTGDLKEITKENDDFRRVLFTGGYAQLVVMTINAGDDIGEEVHAVDQVLYAVEGEGEATLEGKATKFEKGDVVAVPAGIRHNIRNTHREPLKLFTIYAPPQHSAGTIHASKAGALAAEGGLATAQAQQTQRR
jgi:mannose-6-phosphate isomerase-like protein (cupin superfamily)